MLFLKFSLLVTVADIVTHFSSLVLFETDLRVILAKGVRGQVLFFAYPIKVAKGHAEGVEFKGREIRPCLL